MTMDTDTTGARLERPAARRTYGNVIVQKSAGLGGAGLLGTGVLLGGLVLTMAALLVGGLKAAAVVAVVAGLAFTAVGTPVGGLLVRRQGYRGERRAGEHQFRSGVFSRNRVATMRLPGMLGKTQLLTKRDAFGNDFAVVKDPRKRGLFTMVARCVADGPWMQDAEQIDAWVGGYGSVLTALGQEGGALVCAKAITDTAPDPGGRLGLMVRSRRSPQAPAIATAVMEECLADYPRASSENVTYLELTFRGAGPKGLSRKGDEAVVLAELARRVPGVLGQLQAAGGGSVDMVTAAELPRILRVAYDPAAQPFLEAAELSGGFEGDDHTVEWADAGPVASQEFWDHLVHDSGRSITWEMTRAPAAPVTERALAGLLAPHPDFARKRVALIYWPHSPEEAVKVSENDANTAIFAAQQGKKRETATSSLRRTATEQSRVEVASGAGLVRFALMVTATVTTSGDLEQAAATLESRCGAVPIKIRRCYGSQAAAFATTLPAGFVPWEHTVIPQKVRELL